MNISGSPIYQDLAYLYGPKVAPIILGRLENLLEEFGQKYPDLGKRRATGRVSQEDAILITYGDMLQEGDEAPLQILADFVTRQLSDIVSTIHILPFFPYSSDDGFSVIDYRAVDPALGGWQDVALVGEQFRLMFDAVINHISTQSAWFRGFLSNDPRYRDYFIVVEPGTDLSQVFRPRALPLLTTVVQDSDQGDKAECLVWSTFSPDQIDLNFGTPDVLLDILETLLLYVGHGAEFIRLDAVAYLWKEIGTNCLHLPQTHRVIQLMRKVLDQSAPGVALITETNVPHEENISYFGDGGDEAQMVYNFTLPPLTLHAFQTGKAEKLSQWAETLTLPSDEVTFFNFLASHDGIGLMPLVGLLSESEITALAQRIETLGGHVSYRSNPDGTTSPYELNINYLDALGDPQKENEDLGLVARRFLATQAIMLALRGVPGIYFHSLFGSRGWPAGVQESGRARSINREKLQRGDLEEALADPNSLRYQVFQGYRQLLKRRRATSAFHPNGFQKVIFTHEAIFGLLRVSPDSGSQVICLHNVSDQAHDVMINLEGLPVVGEAHFINLLGEGDFRATDDRLSVTMHPYQVLWLQTQ